ncbi:hypothetical protein WR25_08768 isoform B [Diploscapter pachys]|uniref:Uncharacterized protein n=1 Tax=Diploscapter pachys TaxID=2018661 RepID=A0A2A2JQK7_9BILA|nr:hypothetical protein WR25_08768 isoform A [Diploscapter pachys]PAV64076.1 hypothetical protein WR25_08768 isoform B [Diploscapter pachys]
MGSCIPHPTFFRLPHSPTISSKNRLWDTKGRFKHSQNTLNSHLQVFTQGQTIREMVEQFLLEDIGLFPKRDDHDDDDADYNDDTPRQDEIKDMKKEAEIEIIEIDNQFSKQKLKIIAAAISTDGWFDEIDDEEDKD